jgi:hypothetical protein
MKLARVYVHGEAQRLFVLQSDPLAMWSLRGDSAPVPVSGSELVTIATGPNPSLLCSPGNKSSMSALLTPHYTVLCICFPRLCAMGGHLVGFWGGVCYSHRFRLGAHTNSLIHSTPPRSPPSVMLRYSKPLPPPSHLLWLPHVLCGGWMWLEWAESEVAEA